MKTCGGLSKSYAGALTTGVVFSDKEKFGDEEEQDSINEELDMSGILIKTG